MPWGSRRSSTSPRSTRPSRRPRPSKARRAEPLGRGSSGNHSHSAPESLTFLRPSTWPFLRRPRKVGACSFLRGSCSSLWSWPISSNRLAPTDAARPDSFFSSPAERGRAVRHLIRCGDLPLAPSGPPGARAGSWPCAGSGAVRVDAEPRRGPRRSIPSGRSTRVERSRPPRGPGAPRRCLGSHPRDAADDRDGTRRPD